MESIDKVGQKWAIDIPREVELTDTLLRSIEIEHNARIWSIETTKEGHQVFIETIIRNSKL